MRKFVSVNCWSELLLMYYCAFPVFDVILLWHHEKLNCVNVFDIHKDVSELDDACCVVRVLYVNVVFERQLIVLEVLDWSRRSDHVKSSCLIKDCVVLKNICCLTTDVVDKSVAMLSLILNGLWIFMLMYLNILLSCILVLSIQIYIGSRRNSVNV